MFAIRQMDNLNLILHKNPDIKPKSYPKGKILQYAGELSDKVFYVKSGLLKSYTIDDKGKEHIFLFAPEGWIISDIGSDVLEKEAELFIETLEESEVVSLSRKDALAGDFNTEQLTKTQRLLFRRITVLQRRLIMMMSATAQERYEHFLETYPALPNRVPQRMIASYLGITPEALSKIRGKMARSK